jgi:hypothetical protein
MKPYEEIEFPNGFLRWIREDGKYVCRMTEEEMVEIKALHESPYEAPHTWAGLTDEDNIDWVGGDLKSLVRAVEAKLKEKNT